MTPHALPAPLSESPAPLDLAALLGPAAWARLPAAVRRRFAAGHAEAHYQGELSLRCSRIGRLFAWASRCFKGPLTTLRASHLPATVRVAPDGQGGVVWERWIGSGTAAACVSSTKERGPDGGLVERTVGGLGMALDLFEQDGALVFQSRRYFLAWRGLRLPLPNWASPGVCRVSHQDLGGGCFRFSLSMTHPLWGETFHQTGVFADPEEA